MGKDAGQETAAKEVLKRVDFLPVHPNGRYVNPQYGGEYGGAFSPEEEPRFYAAS